MTETRFGVMTAVVAEDARTPGLCVGDRFVACAGIVGLDSIETVDAILSQWDTVMPLMQNAADRVAAGELDSVALADVRVAMPHTPPQVFCTGANYHRHVVEIIVDRFSERMEGKSRAEIRAQAEAMMAERARSGQPYIFTRIRSSYAGPFDDLCLPAYAKQPDWEAELGVVFKKGGLNIPRKSAMEHVAGYLVVNDITSRDQIFTADPKELGTDWLHAKNSPGFFPMGPMIVPKDFIPNPHDLRIVLKLNGQMMQDERTSDMIFDIPRQIEVLSKYARILPGDVLATGSPAGNGTHYGRYLTPGDVMEVSVEGLGEQRINCVASQ